MINEINIENFKSFKKLNIKGFKRINLIAGMNGAGKTTLLEIINKTLTGNDFSKNTTYNYHYYIKELISRIKSIFPYSSEEMMMQGILSGSEEEISRIIGQIYYGNDKAYFFDTIEKSLHYTVMKKVWKVIFELSIEKNVQIFSTSHSQEMIAAFAECCLENNWEEDGAYFEMSKNNKTGKIGVANLTIEFLDKKIKHDNGFRGE